MLVWLWFVGVIVLFYSLAWYWVDLNWLDYVCLINLWFGSVFQFWILFVYFGVTCLFCVVVSYWLVCWLVVGVTWCLFNWLFTHCFGLLLLLFTVGLVCLYSWLFVVDLVRCFGLVAAWWCCLVLIMLFWLRIVVGRLFWLVVTFVGYFSCLCYVLMFVCLVWLEFCLSILFTWLWWLCIGLFVVLG